jgi:hypothetical protein
MKFYNLYKLNVKVGDNVYNPYTTHHAEIIHILHNMIYTDKSPENGYCSYGIGRISYQIFTIPHLICDRIPRIISK